MRIYSRRTLRTFWEEHPNAKASLEFWYETVENSDFDYPSDIIARFKNADIIGNRHIVFNIARNKYRLIVKFEYQRRSAYVRFIGTHKEYDKIDDIENL